MGLLGMILKLSVSLTFIFAGFAKLIQIRNSSRFVKKLGIFPEKVGAMLGFFMPIIELVVGFTMIFNNNIYIEIIALAIIMFFIGLNLKAVLDKKELECFCYGKLIKTKIGASGLIHYLYLLICLISSFFVNAEKITKLIYDYNFINQVFIIMAAMLIFINSIIIQVVIDKA